MHDKKGGIVCIKMAVQIGELCVLKGAIRKPLRCVLSKASGFPLSLVCLILTH